MSIYIYIHIGQEGGPGRGLLPAPRRAPAGREEEGPAGLYVYV